MFYRDLLDQVERRSITVANHSKMTVVCMDVRCELAIYMDACVAVIVRKGMVETKCGESPSRGGLDYISLYLFD